MFGNSKRVYSALLALFFSVVSGVASAEIYWLDSRYDPNETHYRTDREACITGELQRRLDGYHAASNLPHRYLFGSVQEVDGYSMCRGQIQKKQFGRWLPVEVVSADVYQTGSTPPCSIPGLADPETGQCGVPKCDDDCERAGGNGSNPIDTATGNKRQKETDYIGTGAFPLHLQRTYNSHRTIDNQKLPIGVGWTHSYAPRLASLAAGSTLQAVRAFRPNGAVQTFTFNGTAWAADADVPERLTVVVAEGVMTSATYTRADDTVETYDGLGKLVSITSRDGYTQQLSYIDGAGVSPYVQTVTDPEGRVLRFTYSAGQLVSVTDPAGSVINYTYAGGNLVSVGYPVPGGGQAVRTYHYNESGQTSGISQPNVLTGITDESNSRYASWAYDSNRRGTLSVHGPFATGTADRVSLVYASGGTSQVTDSLGTTRSFGFFAQHRVARLTGLDELCLGCTNVAKSKTYDSNGMPDKTTDFAGQITDTDYNVRLLQTSQVEASADIAGRKRTTQTDWHVTFRVPTERRIYDAAGALVSKINWTYNSRGQALTITRSDPVRGISRTTTTSYCEQAEVTAGTCPVLGLVTKIDGPRTDISDVTTYTYYASDASTCATAPTTCAYRKGDLWKVTNALGQVTETLKYDGAGRVLSVRDVNGVSTDLEYHPRGWLTARKVRGTNNSVETDDQIIRMDYWPTGLVKQVTQPDGAFTAYVYDAAHRLTNIKDNAGNTIHYTLDNAGNRLKEDTTDTAGVLKRTLSRVYNQLGQLKTQADAGNNPTDFSYDANGNTDVVTDALGRKTDNDYDPLNRLSRTLQDVGNIAAESKFAYDAQDNLTEVIDPKGLKTTYAYNGLGDMEKLTSPDTGVTTYTYDSAGNRSSQTDARGVVTNYSYDALNRLLKIEYPSASALNVSSVYDVVPGKCITGETFGKGRLAATSDGSGLTQYCYDRFGNLVRKVQTTNSREFTVRYAYTKSGQLSSMTYPDGSIVAYTRDAQGRVTQASVTPQGGSAQVVVNTVTYAPFGPATGWKYGNGRSLQRALDRDYRTTHVLDSATGGLDIGLGYNAVGNIDRLFKASSNTNDVLFGYDRLNRLTLFRDAPSNVVIEQYGYDKTGNRTSLKTASGTVLTNMFSNSHRVSAVGGVTRIYDAAGNTTNIAGTTQQFVYGAHGRMTQAKRSGAINAQYAYNSKGERVRKWLGTANTYTVYDEAGHWLGDYDTSGAPLQQAIWLDDMPIGLLAKPATGTVTQLHYVQPDHLGTPRAVIDPVRNVAVWNWNLKSEAFGNSAPNQDPDGDGIAFGLDMRFPGQRYDKDSGFNYNYFRDYDPATGRYVESDPIGLQGGVSTYGYAGGAPTIAFDLLGLECRTIYGLFFNVITCDPPFAYSGNSGSSRGRYTPDEQSMMSKYCPGENKCQELKDNVNNLLTVAEGQIQAMRNDRLLRNLYQLAFSEPNREATGTRTTWQNHREKTAALLERIRKMIDLGQKLGCNMSSEYARYIMLQVPYAPD